MTISSIINYINCELYSITFLLIVLATYLVRPHTSCCWLLKLNRYKIRLNKNRPVNFCNFLLFTPKRTLKQFPAKHWHCGQRTGIVAVGVGVVKVTNRGSVRGRLMRRMQHIWGVQSHSHSQYTFVSILNVQSVKNVNAVKKVEVRPKGILQLT